MGVGRGGGEGGGGGRRGLYRCKDEGHAGEGSALAVLCGPIHTTGTAAEVAQEGNALFPAAFLAVVWPEFEGDNL